MSNVPVRKLELEATHASLTQASDVVTAFAYEKAASVLIGKRNINASDVYVIDA